MVTRVVMVEFNPDAPPEHIRMSKSNFIQHVAHRWVSNLRSGGPDRGHEE
ncbi:MAG: hypothetical protein ACE5I7_01120 [Candidatus Binatia bacterium]